MLKGCTIPEFVGAYDEFIGYFANVFSLVPAVKKSERAFSGMVNLLQFREITNTCLGYSSNGTRGNGIGEKLAKKIAESIIEIYDFGEIKILLKEQNTHQIIAIFAKQFIGLNN